MKEAEVEVLLFETWKNPETDGYERDRSLRSEQLKMNEIKITEAGKNWSEKRKSYSNPDIREISPKGEPDVYGG